jgi:hypothetical protein
MHAVCCQTRQSSHITMTPPSSLSEGAIHAQSACVDQSGQSPYHQVRRCSEWGRSRRLPTLPEPSSSFSTSLTGSGAGCGCSFCLREDGFFLSSWCLSSWSSWSSFTRFPPRAGAGFAVVGVVVAASSPLEVLFGDFDWDADPLVFLPLLPRPWSLLDMVGCQPSQTRAQSNSDPFAPPLHALFPLAAAISPLTSFCATPDNTSHRPAPDGSQTVDETPSFRNLPSPSQVSSLAFVNHSIQYRYQCSHIAASPDAPRRLPMVPPKRSGSCLFSKQRISPVLSEPVTRPHLFTWRRDYWRSLSRIRFHRWEEQYFLDV